MTAGRKDVGGVEASCGGEMKINSSKKEKPTEEFWRVEIIYYLAD
jgi:hypothetical protein